MSTPCPQRPPTWTPCTVEQVFPRLPRVRAAIAPPPERFGQQRAVARGDVLFRSGDAFTAVWVPLEGMCMVIADDDDGSERIVGFHIPGEFIGLDGLARDRHRYRAEAIGPGRICQLPMAVLEHGMRVVPGLQMQFLGCLGRAAALDHDHLTLIHRENALEKVGCFLADLSARLQAQALPHLEFELPMRRQDIGAYLGIALETVSRCLTRLVDDGVIAVRGRRLRILDPCRLRHRQQGGRLWKRDAAG